MSSKWCVTVLAVLWATVLSPAQIFGSDLKTNGRNSGSAVLSEFSGDNQRHFSSDLSLSDRVKQIKVTAHRIKRETDGLMLKVRLSNGSYIYRKVSRTSTPSFEESHEDLTRVARGYSNSRKTKGGYGYTTPKPKGYVYTTPSTTLPPLSEFEEQNNSEFLNPPETPPPDSSADRDFITTPAPTTTTEDPWDIRDSVPGEPGKDYNVLGGIPQTNFTCEGRTPGFYADVETKCQVFHRCTDDPWYTGQVRVTMDSFLCPNGSLFNQQIYTCDWWGNVDCQSAPEFYQLNEQIGQLEETNAGTIQYVQFSGVRVPPPPGQKQKAPGIVPKSQRQPLPEQYRSRHNEGHSHEKSNAGTGSALSADTNTNDDPEGLIKNFGRQLNSFEGLSAKSDSIEEADNDRDSSSQNIDEVSEAPPKPTKASKKSSKKTSKKSKKKLTTTTTTTPAPEISDEEESDETGEEDDEEEEEESAATNEASGFIVNRPGGEQTDAQNVTPPAVLAPPTSDFKGEPVDKARQDDGYIPPANPSEGPTYIPPTEATTTASSGGYSYPKPNEPYLPPKQNSDYLPPKQNDEYLPPKKDDGYLPPSKPNDEYLPPKNEGGYLSGSSPATTSYLPPTPATNLIPYTVSEHTYSENPDSYYRKPSTGYGGPPTPVYSAPTPPTNSYGPPQAPNREYLPAPQPQQPNREYLPSPPNPGYNLNPSQQPSNQYLPSPPQRPNGDYLPPSQPQQPSNQYLPSPQQQPSNQYLPGPPQNHQPNRDYLPPSQPQQPSTQYLPSQPQQPSNQYLPSPQQPSNQYLPSPPQHNSNQGYSSQQPKREYLPSPPQHQQPSREYLPSPQPQRPSNQYLPSPPQHPNQGYPSTPNQPSKEYLPSPPQQPSREYLPGPQQPNREYLPAPQHNSNQGYSSNQPQQPNREYLPAPQQPSREYLPAQQHNSNQGYSSHNNNHNQQPNRDYLPPQGYSQNRPPVTVEHWPAKYDYEAPTSPSTVQAYLPPTQSPPPAQNYGTPNSNQNYNQAGYQTRQQGLIPPSKEYGQSNSGHQHNQGVENEYFPVVSPTAQSLYSTIPVQTPPPRDEGTGGSRPYTVKSPINIEFYQVPLVSYSQVVHPTNNQHRVSR